MKQSRAPHDFRAAVFCLAVFVAITMPPLFGQSDAGRIQGTVAGATTAIICSAAVTLRNEKTGPSRITPENNEEDFYGPRPGFGWSPEQLANETVFALKFLRSRGD